MSLLWQRGVREIDRAIAVLLDDFVDGYSEGAIRF